MLQKHKLFSKGTEFKCPQCQDLIFTINQDIFSGDPFDANLQLDISQPFNAKRETICDKCEYQYGKEFHAMLYKRRPQEQTVG